MSASKLVNEKLSNVTVSKAISILWVSIWCARQDFLNFFYCLLHTAHKITITVSPSLSRSSKRYATNLFVKYFQLFHKSIQFPKDIIQQSMKGEFPLKHKWFASWLVDVTKIFLSFFCVVPKMKTALNKKNKSSVVSMDGRFERFINRPS